MFPRRGLHGGRYREVYHAFGRAFRVSGLGKDTDLGRPCRLARPSPAGAQAGGRQRKKNERTYERTHTHFAAFFSVPVSSGPHVIR